MNLKAHARHSLEKGRAITEGILAAFKSADDWFYQAHPQANYPLWIAAHLGLADNMFASRFRPASATKPDGWDELFWFGSEMRSDRAAYPSVEKVLAYVRDRRTNLLRVLDEVTEAELDAPAPPPTERSPIAGAPSMGHVFLFASIHEAMHCGQLSVAHRGLGNQPLFQPKK